MASSNHEYDCGWKKNLPVGFHFVPTDEELNTYLKFKSRNTKIPAGIFSDLDIYQYEPQELSAFAEKHWDGRMYFFTPLRKKYETGVRIERIINSKRGFWKASQARKKLSDSNKIGKGTKTSLVYYELRPENPHKKTSWLMLEYRFPSNLKPLPVYKETTDELTLCVIYYHRTKKDDDHQIAMLPEPNDLVPLQSPINQNFDQSPYTSSHQENLCSNPNFVSNCASIQQYQPLTNTITTSPDKHPSLQSYTDVATTSIMQPSFPQLPQNYTDIATTSTMQPSIHQLLQNYTDVATTSTMQLSFPQLSQSYTDIATTSIMQSSFPQLPQSYTDIATTSQPCFSLLPQISYADIATTSTMQPSFSQLPYDHVTENPDIFSSIHQNYDFSESDPSISQYLNLDDFLYTEDEDIGNILYSNADSDQNKLEICVTSISQDEQRPSSDSQDLDQQRKMKKIKT